MKKLYELGLYEKAMPGSLSWREKLAAAKLSGYDFMEISIDETDTKLSRLDMNSGERKELVKAMFDEDLPIRSMCLSGHRRYPLGSDDPEAEKNSLDIMKKALSFASDIGIRIIMLAGYDVYYEHSTQRTKDRFLKNLHRIVNMAAAEGIIIAFETMETPFMNTVEKAMAYVTEINSPYLQIYPDIGNITNAAEADGHDLWMDLRSGRGHIVAMHLKETLPGVFRNMMYGEGHVDFRKAIDEAWHLGVRRYVTEFWDDGSVDWMRRLEFASSYQKEILDNCKE